MTTNRPDSRGRCGTGQTTKSVVGKGKTSRGRHRRERPTGNPWLAVQSAFRAEGKAPALSARSISMVSDAPHDPHNHTHTQTTGIAAGQLATPPPPAKR